LSITPRAVPKIPRFAVVRKNASGKRFAYIGTALHWRCQKTGVDATDAEAVMVLREDPFWGVYHYVPRSEFAEHFTVTDEIADKPQYGNTPRRSRRVEA
jgi:hypothetical protein